MRGAPLISVKPYNSVRSLLPDGKLSVCKKIHSSSVSVFMNSTEKRAIIVLAFIFALRMLGLFMVLPVISLAANGYLGSTTALLGVALGAYGLTQAALQIPFGYWSDRIGRRPMILFGLLLFFVGSVVAANAETIYELIAGRCLQGSGAIASVLTALLSDLTREEHRSKAMAAVGGSIGLSFALAMVLGPVLVGQWELSGLFWATALFALLGAALLYLIPGSQTLAVSSNNNSPGFLAAWAEGFSHGNLRRLNSGVFILHMMLTASFMVLPLLLQEQLSLPINQHWKLYLGAFGVSFIAMIPGLIYAQRRAASRMVMRGAALLLIISQLALVVFSDQSAGALAFLVFFIAFNLLEAMMPSELSKQAAPERRGAAMGAFSTSQFLGAFAGGALGGLVLTYFGAAHLHALFALLGIVWWVWMAGYSPTSNQNSERTVPSAKIVAPQAD